MESQYFASESQMFAWAAANFLDQVKQQLKTESYFNVALAGGSTAQGFFSELLKHDHSLSRLSTQIRFFFSDERVVPIDSPDSNAGNAMRILAPLKIPQENFFPMKDAHSYEKLVFNLLPLNQEGVPIFDLIYLGIGSDGHTASLFPYSHLLDDHLSLVGTDHKRISLLPRLILSANKIIFMASGQQKSAILKEIIHGPQDPKRLPAQLILGSKHSSIKFLINMEKL